MSKPSKHKQHKVVQNTTSSSTGEYKTATFAHLPIWQFTSPERIKLTLQNERLKCKQLEQELSKMRSAYTPIVYSTCIRTRQRIFPTLAT